MGQAKAAAQRKLGFTARLYYMGFGAVALLWFVFYSLPFLLVLQGSLFFRESYFDFEGRVHLQGAFLGLAGLCVIWFVLTGTRYSVIKVPRVLPKLDMAAVFFLLLYFLCRIDPQDIAHSTLPPPMLVLVPLWAFVLLGKVSGKEQSVLGHLVLPAFMACVPSGDLSVDGEVTQDAVMTIGVPFLIFAVPVTYLLGAEYIKEHPEYRKIFIFGRGGAARWGGLYSFIKYDFNAFMRGEKTRYAPIYCGKTLWYDDVKLNGRHIGLDSDSMMLTVAAMGGGKSLYAAWNTLLSWEGGAFVLDPKGEHAGRTAQDRPNGKPIHIIDPWSNVSHLYDPPCATFNPLEEIDISSPNARDEIFQIVESCILQEADENANSKHFRENAQKIMTGVIAHVLTEYPKEHHNLPTIYDIILTGAPDGVASDPKAFDVLVDRMAINDAMGRAAMDAAKVLKEAGENERGGFITTLATGLSWVNTPVLRPILMRSSFKMKDIKLDRQTVYLVIPVPRQHKLDRLM